MKLESHYHKDQKIQDYPNVDGKIPVIKICKCPLKNACYILFKKTSKQLLTIKFLDGHSKEITKGAQGILARNVLYFN